MNPEASRLTHRQECMARAIVQAAALNETNALVLEFRSFESPPSESLSSYAKTQLKTMPTDPNRVAALAYVSGEEPFTAVELYGQACIRRLNQLSEKEFLTQKEREEIVHLGIEVENIENIFNGNLEEIY